MSDFEIKITDSNFEETVAGAQKPLLIDFYADWCGPCRMLAPVISEIAEARDDIIVGKINVDENPILSARFGVMSIPMLVVLKGGEITAQKIGFCDREAIEAML